LFCLLSLLKPVTSHERLYFIALVIMTEYWLYWFVNGYHDYQVNCLVTLGAGQSVYDLIVVVGRYKSFTVWIMACIS